MDNKQFLFNVKLGVHNGVCYWFVKEFAECKELFILGYKYYATLLNLYIVDNKYDKGVLIYHNELEEAHIYEIILGPLPSAEEVNVNSEAVIDSYYDVIEELLTNDKALTPTLCFRRTDKNYIRVINYDVGDPNFARKTWNTIRDSVLRYHYYYSQTK